jgi:hypothetical protein
MRRSNAWLWLLCSLAAAGCGEDVPSPDAAAVCGNGVIDPGEACDEGTTRNLPGTGCEPDCTFSCTTDSECDDGEACNGEETCNTTLHRCQADTHLDDGTDCAIPSDDDGTVPGKCVSGSCGRLCTLENDDCDDSNVCNGLELCHPFHLACSPGTPLDCDDDLGCTVDSCDPETGCANTLVDVDMDGRAPSHLRCDGRGGDCDDDDPEVFTGAPELCDGKDNDCDDEIDEEAPYWFTDCDGDGYPGAGAIQSDARYCDAPDPYNPGTCDHWTTRDPSNVANRDCDDLNAKVYPGAVNSEAGSGGYWSRPYCLNTGNQATGTAPNWDCGPAAVSFDYDCSGSPERNITSTVTNATCVKTCSICGLCDSTCQGGGGCTTCQSYACREAGWLGSLPACGQTATWQNCNCSDSCGVLGCFSCGGTCDPSFTSRQVLCR